MFFFNPKILFFFDVFYQANFAYFLLCQLGYKVLIPEANMGSWIISA